MKDNKRNDGLFYLGTVSLVLSVGYEETTFRPMVIFF